MATFTLTTLLLSFAVAAPASPSAVSNSCKYCHGKAKLLLSKSVHSAIGLSCTGCHGGDPKDMDKKQAHAKAKGFKGSPSGLGIVKVCSSCHSNVRMMRAYHLPADQEFEYRTGTHARGAKNGGKPGATCVDCHNSHDVRRVNDTLSPVYRSRIPKTCARCHADAGLMQRHGLPSDTYARYQSGVHGRRLLSGQNLKVPTCHDCHGSHGVTTFRSREVAFMCGHCHSVTRSYFTKSPHFRAFQSKKLGECTTCHGNHGIDTPTPDLFTKTGVGGCLNAKCHDPSKASDKGAKVARTIGRTISAFETQLASTKKRIDRAIQAGIPLRDARNDLEEARRVLLRLGPISHAVSTKAVFSEIDRGRGLLSHANEEVGVKKREIRDRKLTAGIVLSLLLLLVVLLVVKYRRMRRQPNDRP